MKKLVQQKARELGFDDCRITSAQPPASAEPFQRWLAAGCHGEMAYLEKNAQKRIDPQLVLTHARSIVTLATSYARSDTPVPGSPGNTATFTSSIEGTGDAETSSPYGKDRIPVGLVARYARYSDYHLILRERLEVLTQFVNKLASPGTKSLWYVDTGPLLERDLAQRAGLGFIGKHTNLISRKLGNWFYLSEIITTAELEPDAPEPNRCGSCARCLAACPTQAITAPFQLDARRCISYLTIELKGPIPVELRPAIGSRIFGCDDCLAACPWNRFAQEGRLMREHARTDLATPSLLELLQLDESSFKRRFAATPIGRAKRRGLLRNVCVALGNVADETALPALHRAAADPEQLIAEHARWAIDQINLRRARDRRALPDNNPAISN